MGNAVQFPDAELLAVLWLKAQFSMRSETAVVATKIKSPRPQRLVRLSVVDGDRRNLQQATFSYLIECWDATEPLAYSLASLTCALIGAMQDETIGGEWIAQADAAMPVNFPDPDTNFPRYQFTAEVLIQGAAI